MTKLIVLTLWVLTLTAALFILATDVWQGVPLWPFVGTVALGVIGPLGTWAIAVLAAARCKASYPNTSKLAWILLGITGGIVAALALLRLWA